MKVLPPSLKAYLTLQSLAGTLTSSLPVPSLFHHFFDLILFFLLLLSSLSFFLRFYRILPMISIFISIHYLIHTIKFSLVHHDNNNRNTTISIISIFMPLLWSLSSGQAVGDMIELHDFLSRGDPFSDHLLPVLRYRESLWSEYEVFIFSERLRLHVYFLPSRWRVHWHVSHVACINES